MAENFRLLAARDLLGVAGAEAMPSAATRALVDGLDTPSVRRLAGMDGAGSEEVRATFRAALRELAIEPPSPPEAALLLATEVAGRITQGTVSPHAGATEIWRIVRASGADLPELDAFIYAASEWDERPRARARLAAGILAAARDLVIARSG